jgi:hypothetical protein
MPQYLYVLIDVHEVTKMTKDAFCHGWSRRSMMSDGLPEEALPYHPIRCILTIGEWNDMIAPSPNFQIP